MSNSPIIEIPLLNLRGEINELWDEINEAFQRVLRSGHFVLGPEVEAFESEVANFLGVRFAIGLNSGTDALTIGLKSLGISEGDEVITTAFSFFATAEAIIHAGASPVFVDIDPETFNMDPKRIEEAITSRTRAIIPVHLYGNPAPIEKIASLAGKYNLSVLEDAAQAFGAIYEGKPLGKTTTQPFVEQRVGSRSEATAFSFYPTKNLGAYGEGGFLTTNDPEIAKKVLMYRNHGELPNQRYRHQVVGYNSRLDEFQAAILRLKLTRIDNWNDLRRNAAASYRNLLERTRDARAPTHYDGHIYHQFSIMLPPDVRKAVATYLYDQGISTKIYYPESLTVPHQTRQTFTPVSDNTAKSVLSIPIWPGIPSDSQVRVVDTIKEALRLSGKEA